MSNSSTAYPLWYYLCVAVSLGLLYFAWSKRHDGWGVPMIAVVGTAAVWYLLDPIYNGYETYARRFTPEVLDHAWMEVLLFLVSLGVLTPAIHNKLNADYLHKKSTIFRMMESHELDTPYFQDQVDKLTYVVFIAFCALSFIGLMRTNFDFIGLFFPYLGEKASPWDRGRIGSGLDFLLALAIYLQIMLNALLGVVFALAKRPRSLILGGLGFFLATPFFLFDRTRSYMLAVLVPGLMALVALRMKGLVLRLIVVVVGFVLMEGWFKFVIDMRDQGGIAALFAQGKMNEYKNEMKDRKHLGFNMFEELCNVNFFIDNGSYHPNFGQRYFAELVNPVPRFLWPNKPLIGIDYAIARGMTYGNQDSSQGGVACTVSTGMIGQGIVNFGYLFGPIAAAALMGLWVAVLARQDLQGQKLGNLLLYSIGLVLTYNMGRDITLLIIYPFLFGWLLLLWINKNTPEMLMSDEEAPETDEKKESSGLLPPNVKTPA